MGIVLALTLLPRVARAEEELGELPPRDEAEVAPAPALEFDRQAA